MRSTANVLLLGTDESTRTQDRIGWIRNQLSHIPDSDAKDYVCLNYYLDATQKCEGLL